MKYSIHLVLIIIVAMSLITIPAQAQTITPHIIDSTKPMSDELKAQVNAWLATSAPGSAPYYIVTNWSVRDDVTRVSMLSIQRNDPAVEWSFENDGDVIVWMGSIKIYPNGNIENISQHRSRTIEVASLILPSNIFAPPAGGGGSYVSFPFASGKAVIYGPRSVHGNGDYGTTGMRAVDLVSGDDLGPDAAPPEVYASDAGSIDYVCTDGTSVAVRTYNANTGDYFVYAHLVDNANLVEEETFARGQLIGTLVYGTFNDSCGWAEQQEDHYHNHWMFVPSNNAFQAEGCVLSITTKKWTCGTDVISTGGWLRGGGGFGTGLDDVTANGGVVSTPTFFDYVLGGLLAMFSKLFLVNMPTHDTLEYTYTIINTITLVLRIAYVLVRSNINLLPVFIAIGYGLAMQILLFGLWLIAAIFKAWKSLVPIIGA